MAMPNLHLITDRTQADVELAKRLTSSGWARLTTAQKELWEAGLKGSYNATDLNRVGNAMAQIADAFNEFGYSVDISPKTDWTEHDVPTKTDVDAYLSNLSTLRAAFSVIQGTPSVPDDLNNMTVEMANDIEKILDNISTVLNRIDFSQYRANSFMFYAGQMPFPSFYDQYILADNEHYLLRTSDGKFLMVW